MEWNHSDTIALAKQSCTLCRGEGLRGATRKGPPSPCNCVLRAIFRACLNRFHSCCQKERYLSQATINIVGRHNGASRAWGRKQEEYIADFTLISKRVLDEGEYKLFRYHFLLGADWKLCCRYMKLDRGLFFHSIYRIQQKLGKEFRELQPYGLFPLDEYFGNKVQRVASAKTNIRQFPAPVRPPVRQVA